MSKHKWLAVAALLWAGASAAQAPGQPQVVDQRWYISPSVGFVYAGGDSGPGGSISIGRSVGEYFGFEFEGGYSSLDVGDLPAKNKYERITGGVNLLAYLAPQDWSVRPYLLGNVNGHSIDFLGQSLGGGGVGAGGGVFINLSPRVDLRLEARYNLDFISEENTDDPAKKAAIPKDTFYVLTGGLGARFKFGADPYDSDGDGVPDNLDKCPDTPKGVTVYSDGCPTDLDRDGVPDYLDKCPGTPLGTVVNADGCPADADGDGVLDDIDQCPGTPPGIPVDAKGCPLDSDGDGVPDYLDKCPGTKPGTPVNAAGCPSVDSDGDGVPDDVDRCPNTARGTRVGPDGCPLDSDGDGIPDDQDDCPNTPPGLKVLPNGCAPVGDCRKPRAGEAVDANGCAVDQRFVLRGVKFEFDSDRLTKPAELVLDDVADTLASYPDLKVDVEGHTDSLGSDAYNLGLSERRSNSVKRYLGARGVNGNRLRPVGYGESSPIDTNDTEAGRENNRRVEFKVTGG